MSEKSHWLWRSMSIMMVVMMALSPILTAPASGAVSSEAASAPESTKNLATSKAPMAGSIPSGVPTAQPLDKIHPDLRDLALSAAPALPSEYEQQNAGQALVMVEVIAQVSEREDLDLSGFFADGKFIQRPALGEGEVKIAVFFGQVQASELIKLASIARVQVILPVVLEKNGQPDDYPIDDQQQTSDQRGPEDWAALRAKADELRAGSLPWSEAKAFGDGREQIVPQDWFEVNPMGPHKAELAWDRGYTGEGVSVAVNDDGVDHAHPDLMGTQKIYESAVAPEYNGWPMVFSPFSMYLYANDNVFGTSYIAGGYYSVQYVDTSATPSLSACGSGIQCFDFTPLIDYGQLGIEHTYVISSSMSQSGVVHVGTHPDNNLRDFVWGERPAVIVTDPNTAGVYDTVYMDLDDDYDFRDEKPLTRADVSDLANTRNNMIGYRDMNGDGLADISGGKLYFIGDGVTPIPASDWLYGTDAPPPGNGDLIAVANGQLAGGYSHGTQCASNIAGQGVVNGLLPSFADLGTAGEAATPAGAVFGMAPDVGVVDVSDIYWNFASSKIDAYTFEAIGYDGIPSYMGADTDPIQVASNSYGSSDQDNDGWDYDGQYVSQVIRYYAPQLQMTFSTGNGGPGFGTTSPPSPDVGIAVGASTEFDSTGWDSITNTYQIMYNDVIPFSNRGPGARGTGGVDVVAGGAYAAGDLALNYGPPSTFGVLDGNLAWDTWGGTSRSSPVTAGVLALLYDAYMQDNGDWPTYDVAKALLQSSATDINYDSMTQGSGSVNADRGTLVAGGEYGVYAMPTEWDPGDYRSTDYPGFAHLVYPGDTWDQTFEVYNPGAEDITLEVQSGATQLIGSETFDFTITPEMFAAKNPDAFINSPTWIIPITATPEKIAANDWWDNITIPVDTELMIVRMRYPYDQFDVGSDLTADNRFRLAVYNWEDYNGDGEVWIDANGDNTVNVTTTGVVSQIDGYEGTDWNSTETQQWEFGRFGYNRPGGDVLEMWVQNPLGRMLDGLFIGLQQYDLSTVEQTDMSFEIDFYKYQDVSWLSASTDSLVVPAGGNASFDGTINVPGDIPAGAYEAHFKLIDPGHAPYDGHTTVIPVAMSVAAEFPGSAQLGGTLADTNDANNPYNNGVVRGDFDWTWRAESGDWRFFFMDIDNVAATIMSENFNGAFPPAGWSVVDNASTGNVWDRNDAFGADNLTLGTGYSADADSYATCGPDGWDSELRTPDIDLSVASNPQLSFYSNFQDYAGAGDAWVYISIDSGSTWDTLYHQTTDDSSFDTGTERVFDLTDYAGETIMLSFRYSDNGNGCAWFWQIDDVSVINRLYPENANLLVNTVWDDSAPPTDIDTAVLGPTPSQLGSGPLDFPEPGYFGPYTLDTIASSPRYNVSDGIWQFDTSSGGPDDWITAPLQDGLHEILLHNILYDGDKVAVPFTTTVGTLLAEPNSFDIQTYTDSGSVGTVSVTPSLGLDGLVADGYVLDKDITTFTNEPISFVSSNTIEWTDTFTIENGVRLTVNTSSADISDIDLYVFYYDEGEGTFVQRGSSTTGTANEQVVIESPEDGMWMVGINNWSGPAGTFNLTRVVETKQGGITISGLPSGAVTADSTVDFDIDYDFPFVPGVTYTAVVNYGPPQAPMLGTVLVDITKVPAVEKTVDKDVAFPGDELNYTITLNNITDAADSVVMTDTIPANTEFVSVSSNASYDVANNRISFSGSLDANSSETVDLTVMIDDGVAAGTIITNTAEMTADNLFSGSMSDSATTKVGEANFSTSYKSASETAGVGELISYEVHVINTGEALTEVTLTDPIPAGTSYYDHDDSPPYQHFMYNAALDQMEWTGNVAPGEELVFSFEVMVEATYQPGDVVTNEATIAWNGNEMTLTATTDVVFNHFIYLPVVPKEAGVAE